MAKPTGPVTVRKPKTASKAAGNVAEKADDKPTKKNAFWRFASDEQIQELVDKRASLTWKNHPYQVLVWFYLFCVMVSLLLIALGVLSPLGMIDVAFFYVVAVSIWYGKRWAMYAGCGVFILEKVLGLLTSQVHSVVMPVLFAWVCLALTVSALKFYRLSRATKV